MLAQKHAFINAYFLIVKLTYYIMVGDCSKCKSGKTYYC